MDFAPVAFWIFASVTLLAGLMVVVARNPVHSVLFLITAFLSTAGLFVLMGAEYLAMLLVVVYVGAVAVLFLFVVMMLDVDFVEMKTGMAKYAPIAGVFAVVFVVMLALVVGAWQLPDDETFAGQHPVLKGEQVTADMAGPNNAESLGMVLYTEFVHYFQIAGIILLVAMIGAIILTFRERRGVKTQNVARQVGRTREEAVEVISVPTGKGI